METLCAFMGRGYMGVSIRQNSSICTLKMGALSCSLVDKLFLNKTDLQRKIYVYMCTELPGFMGSCQCFPPHTVWSFLGTFSSPVAGITPHISQLIQQVLMELDENDVNALR